MSKSSHQSPIWLPRKYRKKVTILNNKFFISEIPGKQHHLVAKKTWEKVTTFNLKILFLSDHRKKKHLFRWIQSHSSNCHKPKQPTKEKKKKRGEYQQHRYKRSQLSIIFFAFLGNQTTKTSTLNERWEEGTCLELEGEWWKNHGALFLKDFADIVASGGS